MSFDELRHIQWSADSSFLLSASADTTAHVYSLNPIDGAFFSRSNGHDGIKATVAGIRPPAAVGLLSRIWQSLFCGLSFAETAATTCIRKKNRQHPGKKRKGNVRADFARGLSFAWMVGWPRSGGFHFVK